MSQDTEVILKVENLSKQYRLGLVGTGTLSHDLKRWWYRIRGKEDPFLKIGETNDRSTKGESDYVWALKDINFEVKRGEVVGIIGKNGAGKSTLLKILSKVTAPTTGSVKYNGRIASLLEVGTGFHPELTGRENVYLNGAILGMTKKEITGKLDEIIDFSGCQRYIDTPVKRYSSGMTVRLAFAVAAFLEPEILIVDEVLAVGDAEFQKKALGKMQDISKGQGRTVLFVSHNMAAVKSLCSKGIVLENGSVVLNGSIDSAVSHYLNMDSVQAVSIKSKMYEISKVEVVDTKNNLVCNISNGMDFNISVLITINEDFPDLGFCIAIYNEYNNLITAINTYHINEQLASLKRGNYRITFELIKYTFNIGMHLINFHTNSSTGILQNLVENAARFNVYDDGVRRGERFRGEWPGMISLVPQININEIS